jgi:large subunit ribosomal protein L20
MARVKKAVHALKFRRKLLGKTKGYRHARSKKERAAWEAYVHAGKYSFAHRRDRKNDFRALWNTRLSAALRPHGFSYSRFMGVLKKKNILLNRKMLSLLGQEYPDIFSRVVKSVS